MRLRNVFKKGHSALNLRKPITIIVIRQSEGQLAYSKPCFHCVRYIKRLAIFYNIQQIVYSTHDGHLVIDKISDLNNNYISSGNRATIN